MDYYQVLGVDQGANQSDIKKAYRNLVKVHHPDAGGSEDGFKDISNAYETLSDPQKRKEYDLKRGFQSGGFDNFFNQFGGDFSNMFDNAWNQNARGQDINIRIRLTLEEVYYGTTKRIDTGQSTFKVNIPKGIHEGAKLRLKERGLAHPVNSSAPKGDAIIIVNIMPDPDMIVTNGDIWIDYILPFYDILLGGEFTINTKVNKVKIKVPKNSFDGKILRITGMGFPIYNTDQYGNLMVKLRASHTELNEKQLEHVQQIKDLSNV